MTKSIITLALLGGLTLGMADTAATTNNDTTVDAQITAIQNAPAAKRVELMNAFKEKLSTMNSEDRMAAISAMQEKMQTTAQTKMAQGQAMMGEEASKMPAPSQAMQMQQAEQMNKMQMMNQHQTGNQFMQSTMPTNSPMPAQTSGQSGAQTNGQTSASQQNSFMQ